MKEQNIKRVVTICDQLEKCRSKISTINSMLYIDTRNSTLSIDIYVLEGVKDKTRKTISVEELGAEMMAWLISREKLRLQGRIIELEAELSKL
jgi:hypothetical protein